jgi:hypothetical protein
VFKIDFEKAFDTVEQSAILENMICMGFPHLWIKWIHEILSSGTSSIFLNGVPGMKFTCTREGRQGDPLSPLLYVLAGDLLQCIINKPYRGGMLQPPFLQNTDVDYPIYTVCR